MSPTQRLRQFLLGVMVAWALENNCAICKENSVSFLDIFQHRLTKMNSTNNNYPTRSNSRQIDYLCNSYPLASFSIKESQILQFRLVRLENGEIIAPSLAYKTAERKEANKGTIDDRGKGSEDKKVKSGNSFGSANTNKLTPAPFIIIINQSINSLISLPQIFPLSDQPQNSNFWSVSAFLIPQQNTPNTRKLASLILKLEDIISNQQKPNLFLFTADVIPDKITEAAKFAENWEEIFGQDMCLVSEKHSKLIFQTTLAFLSIIDLAISSDSQNTFYLASKNTFENITKFGIDCSPSLDSNDPEIAAKILQQLNTHGYFDKVDAQNLSLNNVEIPPEYLTNLSKCANFTLITLSKTSPLFIHTSEAPTGGFAVKMNSIAAVAIAIVVIACSIATIVGNALVVIAFYVEKKLQITNNYFLVSLSLADGFVGLVSVNIWLMLYLGEGKWPLGWPACVTWIFFDYVWCTTSIYHVFIISIDRCWSVSFPTSYHNRSGQKAALWMIVPTWMVSICYWLVVIVGHPIVFGRFVPDGFCRANYAGQLFLTYASTSITYWVPLIVITILYIHIYKVAKDLKKKKMLQKTNAAAATTQRPNLIDRARKRSPSSPNVITAVECGMLECIHVERGVKTREGSVESNNPVFPDGVPFAGGKKTGSTRHETRMAGTGAPDGGQDSGIEEENDSDQTRNNQHTQTSHGCIPRDREEDSGRTGGGVSRMGASRGVKTHFDQEGSRFNRRLHTLQAPVGMSNACSTPEIVVTASKEEQKGPTKNTLAPYDSVRLSIQTAARRNSFLMSSQQKLNQQHKTNDRKAMKTLTFLLGAFIVCWTPWNIAEIINGLWGPTTVNYNLYQFTWLLTYINSGLNPLCYAFANAVFKDTFIRILSLGRINRQNQKNLRGLQPRN